MRLSASKKCDVGVFVVKNKDGLQQRLILDCRASNRQFVAPPSVSLLTGEGLSRVERQAEGCGAVYLGTSDVKDCFHRLRFPKESKLDEYFAYPEVWASELGLAWWEGERVVGDMVLYPLAQSLPMGWAWSLYFAQEANTRQMELTKELSGARLLMIGGHPWFFEEALVPAGKVSTAT